LKQGEKFMQLRHSIIAAGFLGAFSLYAAAACAKGTTAQDFVTKATIANKFEIDSSNIALKKSQNSDVKSFAQMMVDDHTKTGDKLKGILDSTDSSIKPADELDDKHQKLIDKLNAASGKDFDNKYISMQTDAHKEAVSLFGDYAKKGDDPKLKDFAGETLPALQEHLKHVKQLKAAH
jgi:putative membrane protein